MWKFTKLFAQDIPKSAVILEKANVTPNRQLILWMPNPKKVPREPVEEIYTCPDQTRGHYYSGIAKVSLFDVKTKKLINTIEIISDGFVDENNSLDLPYLIQNGYYSVAKIDKHKEGKPKLLDFKDYNSDGKAQEFALFDAVACMGLETTLIGYSEKQDKVFQYQTELEIEGKKSNEFWVDYLFGHKPNKQGVWKYQIDYRGRAGALEKYEIRYDKKREIFYGKRTSIFEDESNVIKEKQPPHK
jgi:hypothetical protein